jgi:hypothetical protein
MADTDHPARNAVIEQTVWLAAMLVAVPVLIWLEKWAASPDALRTLKMRAALQAESFCMASAREWAGLADRARAVYEAARP